MRGFVHVLLFIAATHASAQSYTISTVAGTGISKGDGGPAKSALIFPLGITSAPGGIVYVSDNGNHVRRITADGTISLFAGNSEAKFSGDGGPAVDAALSGPAQLARDAAGNVYIADAGNSRVRQVGPNGIIHTVAGSGCGNTASIVTGVQATAAPFCLIYGIALDAQGRLHFIGDYRLWRVNADGTLLLMAGTGTYGQTGDNGPALSATIGFPTQIAVDAAGNVYLADGSQLRVVSAADQRIRTVATSLSPSALAIDSNGAIYYGASSTTIRRLAAGTDSLYATNPTSGFNISFHVDDTGALYVASGSTDRVYKLAGGTFSIIAGAYPAAVDPDGTPALATHLQLDSTTAPILIDPAGALFVAESDSSNGGGTRVSKRSPAGTLSTFVPSSTKYPNNTQFRAQAMAVDAAGSFYFATNTQIWKRNSSGAYTLYAGASPTPTNVGDEGPATAARVINPNGLIFDSAGNLYFAEAFDNRVRKVTPGGTISTIAGGNVNGSIADGVLATAARLLTPVDLAFNAAGLLHIAELSGARVRRIEPNGALTTVVGSANSAYISGDIGDGGPATAAKFSGVAGIAFDPTGNLFIADIPSFARTVIPRPSLNRIRMVNTAGIVSTVAGTSGSGYNGDDRLASTALLSNPSAVRTDLQGNVYIADSYNLRIRKLTPGAPATVVEFYNTILDNYFITANAAEQTAIGNGSAGPGWTATGNRFSAGGPSQVCRFYGSLSPGPNSHFYTIDPNECQALKDLQGSTPATQKRWNFESLDFSSTIPAVGGRCEGGYIPVYRAYNNGFAKGIDSNHRITSSSTFYQAQIAKGWAGEGVVMCSPGGL